MLHPLKLVASALVATVVSAVAIAAAGQTPPAPAAAKASLQVADAKLGTGVKDRDITGEAASFAVNDKVFLWLKVTGGPGDVKVTWKQGDASDTVELKIGGDSWRTWSSKTAFKAGAWTVTVTDAAGATLKELKFDVK